MINYIWGFMILIGIAYAGVTGGLENITTIAITSSRDAVNLAITMAGVIAMWSGLLKIAEKSGMIASLTKKMQGPLTLLFPKIPKNHPSLGHISTNFIANFLGLGWAATPAGLNAIKELNKLNRDKRTASNEMCLFMVINMSSLQLVSVNLLAYRMEYNSIDPASIIGPGIFVTFLTTMIGIVICKLFERGREQ